MDEINFSLGQRFAEERQRIGKTQEDLAGLCGVNRRTIGDIERGERPPGGDLVVELTKLGFDIQYVFSGVRSDNLFKVAEEKGKYVAKETKVHVTRKLVDPEVLAGVIAGLDEYLTEHGLTLPTDKKAELIMLLCDFFTAESAKDTEAVKSTAAKILQFRARK